ncbi:hypothetical protein MKX47_21250 [Solibacillus sp. FSL R7-0668]|uniref:hypothetical protein n=1 Tax=Solibacillus sp. FSL R7-0668 TaxID=2921688 RepID=UPI0030FA2F6A
MPINDMYIAGNGVSYVGFRMVEYCRIFWLVDGVRQFKTVCYDGEAMADAINNRTKLTEGLQFEIEYTAADNSAVKVA